MTCGPPSVSCLGLANVGSGVSTPCISIEDWLFIACMMTGDLNLVNRDGLFFLTHINFSVCERDCYALYSRAIFNLMPIIYDNTRRGSVVFRVKENEGVRLDYDFWK